VGRWVIGTIESKYSGGSVIHPVVDCLVRVGVFEWEGGGGGGWGGGGASGGGGEKKGKNKDKIAALPALPTKPDQI